MQSAAQDVIPTSSKKSADWFLENEGVIRPASKRRNLALGVWLASKRDEDRRLYLKEKRELQHLIRKLKNQWFSNKAAEIERSMRRAPSAWESIRQLQQAGGGLRPYIPRTVRGEDSEVCKTPSECHDRWRRHFKKVLNVLSVFDMSVVEAARQRPLHSDLSVPPTAEELESALEALMNGKCGGKNGLAPELVKRVGAVYQEYVLELFEEVWVSGVVPKAWVDAVIVAIPKKGDLMECNNWRGISLLDIVGKVFARILHQRLQKVADDDLAESQCGFCKGCSCIDMIFCL